MTAEMVSVEREGAVAVMRLARQPANAIDLDFCRATEAAFDEMLASDPGAVVITGSGRFFSGGLDLKTVPTYDRGKQRDLILTLNRMVAKLYACPVPLVGAINGHAIAGGFVLALTPDYRVGAIGSSLFGLTEARVGIPFPAAPMIVVRAELSPQHARAVTLQARNFGPEEALAKGVLDELRPADGVLERAQEVARDLATIPADAYRRIKRQVRADAIARLEDLVARGNDPMLDNWFGPEAEAASAAVLQGSTGRVT